MHHPPNAPRPLDASGEDPGYLLLSSRGAPIRLSPSASSLLEAVASGMSFADLAAALSRNGKTVTAAQVAAAHRGLVDRLEQIEERAGATPSSFWFRLPFLPARWVERLARPLAALFHPRAVAVLIAVIIAGLALALSRGALTATVSGGDLAWTCVLFGLSMLLHELGHASACARFGVAPGAIGLTIYLIYPAFYADVTRAWQLPRQKRVVVDLGGIYFQLVAAALYGLAYALFDVQAGARACAFILVSCLVSLNPLFKFDGYWVLADLLGTDRLGYRALQSWRRLAASLRRRLGGETAPRQRLTWPLAVLLFYGPLGLVVWGFFLARLLPEAARALTTLPEQLLTLSTPDAGWGTLHALFLSLVVLLIACRTVRGLATLAASRSWS